MSDVFPTGTSTDSEFLYARMREATFAALCVRAGSRVADVASGVGADDRALAERGVWTVGAEPSARMHALALITDGETQAAREQKSVARIRAWSEALPFRSGSFDAAFCKGSLDHFDDPGAAIREMARITRDEGRVVVAVANFESLGCRVSRLLDRLRRRRRGRRHHDVPSDHYTRYDPAFIRQQVEASVEIEAWIGVSLLWGLRPWARLVSALGPARGARALRLADRIARLVPSLADVLIASGRPRRQLSGSRPK